MRKISTVSLLIVILVILVGCNYVTRDPDGGITNLENTVNSNNVWYPSSDNLTAPLSGTIQQAEYLSDLVPVNIWSTGTSVLYKVVNRGLGDSKVCITRLYMGDRYLTFSYTQPLKPGESRVQTFPNVTLFTGGTPNPEYSNPIVEDVTLQNQYWLLTVCIDPEDSVLETSKENNCVSKIPSQYLDLTDLYKEK